MSFRSKVMVGSWIAIASSIAVAFVANAVGWKGFLHRTEAEPTQTAERVEPQKDDLGVLKEPYAFKRRGEEQATYTVVYVAPGSDGTVVAINTRHSAQSGWNYTRMAIRCEAGENRVLSTADTREGLENGSPDPQWGPLVAGSSRYWVAEKACKVSGRTFGA